MPITEQEHCLFPLPRNTKPPINLLINNRMHQIVIIELRLLNTNTFIILRQSSYLTRSYLACFKTEYVFEMHEVHHKVQTSGSQVRWRFKQLCCKPRILCEWETGARLERQVEKLKCMPKNKCANRGKQCQWPELEHSLGTWIEDQWRSSYIVTRNLIRIKGKAMASEKKVTNF